MARHLLYFTAEDHYLYTSARGRLELEAKFPADDLGVSAFREHLRDRKGTLFAVVADLAGEIGPHGEERAFAIAQMLAEGAHAEIVGRELRFELEPAARARIEVMVLGGEVKEMPCHIRTSSWRWR